MTTCIRFAKCLGTALERLVALEWRRCPLQIHVQLREFFCVQTHISSTFVSRFLRSTEVCIFARRHKDCLILLPKRGHVDSPMGIPNAPGSCCTPLPFLYKKLFLVGWQSDLLIFAKMPIFISSWVKTFQLHAANIGRCRINATTSSSWWPEGAS